jgi:hypothetical protein
MFMLQNDSAACSCLDCTASCPDSKSLASPINMDDDEFLIFDLDGASVIAGIVFLVGTVLLIGLFFIFHFAKSKW